MIGGIRVSLLRGRGGGGVANDMDHYWIASLEEQPV